MINCCLRKVQLRNRILHNWNRKVCTAGELNFGRRSFQRFCEDVTCSCLAYVSLTSRLCKIVKQCIFVVWSLVQQCL